VFNFRWGQVIDIFATASRPALGPTQPPVQWLPGIKWPGREADQLPPSSSNVKYAWNYTFTYPCVLMAWCLIKYSICLDGVVLS
jgi:hypothetical protein